MPRRALRTTRAARRARTACDGAFPWVLPSFVIYLWWLVPALLAALVVIATAVDLADTKVISQPASTRPAA